MHDFFIVSPLNLENEVKKELITKWPIYIDEKLPDFELTQGGINLKCELEQGLKLNMVLRSANKILLRIKEQKCRDLPKLFKIMSKIDWKKFLVKEEVKFVVSAKESRLIHTKRIEDSCRDGLIKYFNANKIKASVLNEFKESETANIYIRLENDNLTISLDTTGELLYKRDSIQFKGIAPLRNNLANIMLQFLLEKTKIDPTSYKLIDPMCGSGTFLHEALNFHKLSKRKFYFENICNDIKIQSSTKELFDSYAGLDFNKNIINKLDNTNIQYREEDLFSTQTAVDSSTKSICIVNPPYGKKVKIKGDRDQYYTKMISTILDKHKPEFLGIIIPEGIRVKRKPMAKIRVFNSGIWVNFCIFQT